ncbi:Uma2 family endonuclease [Sorangium sp. So ce887]|uniref:Uma2 family endonuclease n=1 Tax=Sorangium sp. So ce887 TaxID=3133324 RepID=UPI003F63AC70
MHQGAIDNVPPGRPMTLAEWEIMPEDEPGELVGGRLVEEEVPDFVHELVVGWLIETLRRWLAQTGGFVFASGAKFALQGTRGRKPDLSVFLPGEPRPPRRGAARTPPAVMVEVVSPTPRDVRRDRVEKVKEYASFGVRFYWIVDPQFRTVEILELDASGRYTYAASASSGVLRPVPGCEGLSLDLDALWSEVDGLLGVEEPPVSSTEDEASGPEGEEDP